MTKPKIVITRHFPGSGLERLQKKYEVIVNRKDRVLSPWQLRRFVRGADIIVSLLTDTIDAPVMDAAGPQLKLIANYAVGFDNIDINAAKEREIFVTNAPGSSNQAVAEHTVTLMMATARRIVEADRFMRGGHYQKWDPQLLLGIELHGKTLGIVGLGQIGATVATIAKGFGMKTLYFDERRNKKLEKSLGIDYVSFASLIKQSDIISLHVPLLPTTKHLINEAVLSDMKPSAILINTARGPVVDERALVHALRTNVIRGAGLDVFEHEPEIKYHLERLENVVLTPHIASATWEARETMSQMVADNVIAVVEKGKPLHCVY